MYSFQAGSMHPTGMRSCCPSDYHPQMKLREGNVFTPVCDSVHRGMVCIPAGVVSAWGWPPGTPGHPSPGQTPPRRQLKRAVRILLECILVIIESTKDYIKQRKNMAKRNWNLEKESSFRVRIFGSLVLGCSAFATGATNFIWVKTERVITPIFMKLQTKCVPIQLNKSLKITSCFVIPVIMISIIDFSNFFKVVNSCL